MKLSIRVRLLLPVLALVAVAGIGARFPKTSYAATTAQTTCRVYSFSASGTTNHGGTNISTSGCVKYIQQIVNGAYQVSKTQDKGTHTPIGNYAKIADQYAKADRVPAGLLAVDGKFGTVTASRVRAFQATFQYYSAPTGQYIDLTSDGVIGGQSWGALCGLALRFPDPHVDADYQTNTTAQSANNAAHKMASGCNVKDPNNGIRAHAHVQSYVTAKPKVAVAYSCANVGKFAAAVEGKLGDSKYSGVPEQQAFPKCFGIHNQPSATYACSNVANYESFAYSAYGPVSYAKLIPVIKAYFPACS